MRIVVLSDGHLDEFHVEVLFEIIGVSGNFLSLDIRKVVKQDTDLVLRAFAAAGKRGNAPDQHGRRKNGDKTLCQ